MQLNNRIKIFFHTFEAHYFKRQLSDEALYAEHFWTNRQSFIAA